ncbi:MAG TPA: hypothetical protein VE685_22915 [Thermoanaerobaculia bacterium]|nr:hypothetical protein [Thermoanaerobaculia bacterium]
MLNLAGSSYDFGNVLFAVLQECEHARRGLLPNEAEARLKEIARRKLREVRASYEELGGTPAYWQALEREVLETALPQYIPAAVAQTRLEKTGYGVWRQGDPAARILFGMAALLVGALLIAVPPNLLAERGFAFLLAVAGFLYPEIKQAYFDFRHSRLLNRLIVQAEKYQKNSRIHYVSEAQLQEELDALGKKAGPERGREGPKEEGRVLPHPSSRGKER